MEKRMDTLETRVDGLEEHMSALDTKIIDIRLHLEHVTDRNVSLLAENHLELGNKLNAAVKVSEGSALQELRMNLLGSRVDKLEKDMVDVKNMIA